jgi:hypothetical protein
MWLQMVMQLKLVIPAPDEVLVGGKLWPRENSSLMLKKKVLVFIFRHILSQQKGLETKRKYERKAEASITRFS